MAGLLDRVDQLELAELHAMVRVFEEQQRHVQQLRQAHEQGLELPQSPATLMARDEELARQLMEEFALEAQQARASEEQSAFEALRAAELKCSCCEQMMPDLASVLTIPGCEHRLCRVCVAGAVERFVSAPEGPAPGCPAVGGCSYQLGQTEIRQSVEGELFEKYATLTLTQAIQGAADLIECPHCHNVVELVIGSPDPTGSTQATARGLDGQLVSKEAQQHAARYRFRCRKCDTVFCSKCGRVPYHIGFSCEGFEQWTAAKKCFYCQGVWVNKAQIPSGKQNLQQTKALLSKLELQTEQWAMSKRDMLQRAQHIIENVCDSSECRKCASQGCLKVLPCGHLCGGVVGERECLPCLHPGCNSSEEHSRDDFCNICWVADLGSEPCIKLACGHIFHADCLRGQIQKGYTGARITFGHMSCPLCKKLIQHPSLEPVMVEGMKLYKLVSQKAVQRLELEKLGDHPQIESHFNGDRLQFALKKFAYYKCHKCTEPYFGGQRACEAVEEERQFDPAELVCSRCSMAGSGSVCPIHGSEFIEWKCKFCCTIASWFCWGNTHFCDECHKKQGTPAAMTKKKLSDFPICQGAHVCPLKVEHPKAGTEFCLGCAICRNA